MGARPNSIDLRSSTERLLYMKRVALPSRMLRSVGYEVVTTTLEVELADGTVYRYFGVPERRYQSLLAATPPDEYMERHITKIYRAAKVA